MRLYDNPLIAAVYFLGVGVKKLQRDIETRGEKKELESAIKYFSSSEEERKKHSEIMERREKWAFRSFIIAIIGLIFGYSTIDQSPILALIILTPTCIAIIYGLWYSLDGKYG